MGFFDTALGGIVGGILGDTVGSAVNSAFDLNSYEKKAEIDYNYTKKLWDYQMQNKHQLEVSDLEAAGLNKMLSAINGQAVNATAIGGSSSDNRSNVGQTAMQLAMEDKKADIENKKADIELKNSQTEAQNAATREFEARTQRMRAIFQNKVDKANIGYIGALSGKTFAETQKVIQDRLNSIKELQGKLSYLKSGEALNYAEAQKAASEIVKIASETGLIDSQKYNLDLLSAQITKDLSDPKKATERAYYSSLIGQAAHMFNLFIDDINPFAAGGAGISAPVGTSGVRVGIHG